ncbi:MAG: PIN domain-containing protein [Mycobacteriales bacterium]
MTVICDTSALLNAINTEEEQHSASTAALSRHRDLVVSPLVLAELDYLAAKRVGSAALRPFFEDLKDGVYEVAVVTGATIATARELDTQYAQLRLGLTDAVNIVLAHDYHTDQILTLDAHYRAVQPLTRHPAFRLLPADDVNTQSSDGA